MDHAAEREAAGSRWQDTGRVFTTATGIPLGARHIRKMFQDVCERAGLGRDWAPRDLRHTFVSLLSDDGMAIGGAVPGRPGPGFHVGPVGGQCGGGVLDPGRDAGLQQVVADPDEVRGVQSFSKAAQR